MAGERSHGHAQLSIAVWVLALTAMVAGPSITATAQAEFPVLSNLRTAHTKCVSAAFHLSDTNPATVERAMAACQTEEQAYLSAAWNARTLRETYPLDGARPRQSRVRAIRSRCAKAPASS